MTTRHPFPLDGLSVDRTLPVPLHRQLYGGLRRMIEDRFLSAGSVLPSSRTLSEDLGVARNTVVGAYEQLATEGYIVGRPGARPTVVDLPGKPAHNPPRGPGRRRLLSARGQTILAQPHHHGQLGHLAFHPGMPDPDNFPFSTWSRLLARRAKKAAHDLFGSYSVIGYPALREAIADYVRVARGVHCAPEQVVVTTGAQAGLDLLARLLLDPGEPAWVEEPGYYGAQAAFVAAGARLRPLHVANPEGWQLDRAPRVTPGVIYVTPACQFPLGVTMRMEQRLRLLDVAERLDAWIIEDDFDGEYRFQGRPVPAIQGIDRSDRVIYLGTFAKLLFPALRLGFMILPEPLLDGVALALRITGQFAPLLLQAALADFIERGYMSTHLRRMRRIYAARREAFMRLAESTVGEWLTLGPTDAGIQLVGELRPGMDDIAVAAAARLRGINVSPLSIHYRHAHPVSGLLLGYAAVNETAMRHGFRLLAQAFQEVDKPPAAQARVRATTSGSGIAPSPRGSRRVPVSG